MPAIKSLSKKLPPLWAVKLQPSLLHSALLLGTTLASGAALVSLDIGWLATCLTLTSLLLIYAIAWRTSRIPRTLEHRPDGRWRIRQHGYWQIGELQRTGYRSSLLIVFDLKTGSGKKLIVPVWCDSLTRREFSYLHWQLTYGNTSQVAVQHQRRNPLQSKNTRPTAKSDTTLNQVTPFTHFFRDT